MAHATNLNPAISAAISSYKQAICDIRVHWLDVEDGLSFSKAWTPYLPAVTVSPEEAFRPEGITGLIKFTNKL
ncbi:hypothetical protein GJ744_012349 [Endocarpon pusillum]|uniref:Uncharacterized protein n=1 Tax=Endocarpon pusillum TaxID=364733 RepID=A0A8H7AF98_9EURO|nr:hypothetical protein GJ744_012349 [Endocarpon pusillum]